MKEFDTVCNKPAQVCYTHCILLHTTPFVYQTFPRTFPPAKFMLREIKLTLREIMLTRVRKSATE